MKILTILLALSLPLNKVLAEPGSKQVHLLELFSSESCSSCPPADAWLSQFKSHPELWKSFIPVAFHVDYWNYLDWKDSFSQHSMTQRQIDITNLWRQPSVYTPGVILDGQELKNWSSKQLPNEQNKTSIELKINGTGDFNYSVASQGLDKNKKYRVRMALLGFGVESDVTSGENKGKKLMHDFLVLQWDVQELDKTLKNKFKFHKPEKKYKKLAVVSWIEQTGSPLSLQATGHYL